MPVSKNGKPWYTKEQYRIARESSALAYAQARGYDLVRSGAYYHMREHDSMIFSPQGVWFWNSRGIRGGAIEFCMYYEGMSYTEAVLTLAGDTEGNDSRSLFSPSQSGPEAQVQFKLPEQAKDCRRLFAYLCQTRGLCSGVVREMIRQKLLYEGVSRKNGREYHNAVFVYYDPQGRPVGAFQRGLNPGVSFKMDVPGSSKQYGWLLKGGSGGVYVFEAAIDAASQACLGGETNVDRLSLEGLDPRPLNSYLALHPGVKEVTLMLDADKPGQEAAVRMRKSLAARGYNINIVPPSAGKDYNELLLRRTERRN